MKTDNLALNLIFAKLLSFQTKADIKIFERIFDLHAGHLYRKYAAYDKNIVKFWQTLDKENTEKLFEFLRNDSVFK